MIAGIRKTFTLLALLLVACVALSGSAAASGCCGQMITCCQGSCASMPGLDSGETDGFRGGVLCCGSEAPEACSCALQSGQSGSADLEVLASPSRSGLIVPSPTLVLEPRQKVAAQTKPDWPLPDDAEWEIFLIPNCSYPNPPPAAA